MSNPEYDLPEEPEDDICPKCKCCSVDYEPCWNCDGKGGRDGEDLMSEDPLWYGPEDFETCHVCNGKGHFPVCLGNCNEHGEHSTF